MRASDRPLPVVDAIVTVFRLTHQIDEGARAVEQPFPWQALCCITEAEAEIPRIAGKRLVPTEPRQRDGRMPAGEAADMVRRDQGVVGERLVEGIERDVD